MKVAEEQKVCYKFSFEIVPLHSSFCKNNFIRTRARNFGGKLGARLRLKHCREMYSRTTMYKPSTNIWK